MIDFIKEIEKIELLGNKIENVDNQAVSNAGTILTMLEGMKDLEGKIEKFCVNELSRVDIVIKSLEGNFEEVKKELEKLNEKFPEYVVIVQALVDTLEKSVKGHTKSIEALEEKIAILENKQIRIDDAYAEYLSWVKSGIVEQNQNTITATEQGRELLEKRVGKIESYLKYK